MMIQLPTQSRRLSQPVEIRPVSASRFTIRTYDVDEMRAVAVILRPIIELDGNEIEEDLPEATNLDQVIATLTRSWVDVVVYAIDGSKSYYGLEETR